MIKPATKITWTVVKVINAGGDYVDIAGELVSEDTGLATLARWRAISPEREFHLVRRTATDDLVIRASTRALEQP